VIFLNNQFFKNLLNGDKYMLEVLESFIMSFIAHPILVTFIGTLIAGESVILTLSFLSASGLFPFWIIFVFAILGEFVSDLIWYALGRIKIIHKFHNSKKFSLTYQKVDEFIMKLSKESIFRAILYSKFAYGTRTFVLIYLGLKKADLKQVVFSLAVISFLFVLIVSSIGYFAGKGFVKLLDIFEDVKLAITFVIVVIIILFILKKVISNILVKRRKKLLRK